MLVVHVVVRRCVVPAQQPVPAETLGEQLEAEVPHTLITII